MSPSARASSAICALTPADSVGGVARRGLFAAEARNQGSSAVRQERREFGFRNRLIAQAELHRHIIEPARSEAAIEMPQPWYDHAHHGDLEVGPSLVEHQEVEACAPGDL